MLMQSSFCGMRMSSEELNGIVDQVWVMGKQTMPQVKVETMGIPLQLNYSTSRRHHPHEQFRSENLWILLFDGLRWQFVCRIGEMVTFFFLRIVKHSMSLFVCK